MRIYSRIGATEINDPQHGRFTAGPDGGIDVPQQVGAQQLRFHSGGQPLWEDIAGRAARLMAEEAERRKDPATLLAAVEQLVAAAKATAPAKPDPAPAAKAEAPAKAAAKTSAKTDDGK